MHIKSIQAGKRYGDLWALRQISLPVPLGAPLLLLGPSGGGKSTLLRLLAGLESPDEGSIQVDGARGGEERLGDGEPSSTENLGKVGGFEEGKNERACEQSIL